MLQIDLDYFKRWFDEYVAQFYDKSGDGPRPVRLKEQHTKRVCKEILFLGHELRLSEQDLLLAETIALFHDLGRFPQWNHYRTFNDCESRDHAQLALEVISRQSVLRRIRPAEQEVIIQAIRYHNLKELPADLPSRHLDGEWIPLPVAVERPRPEIQPQRLRLVHRQHHTAVREPAGRHVFGEVVDVAQRKIAQPRRQRIVLVVVRDAQRALETDLELGRLVDLRK